MRGRRLDERIHSHYNKYIAHGLDIMPRMVGFHRANMVEKKGVDLAVAPAYKLGRLEPLG